MVSIIIPTLNEEKELPNLLNCLRDQTYNDFEVIISDANSKDNTRVIAEKYGAIVVEGGLPGVGRNVAARIAKSDTLVFIDADCVFENDFLRNSLEIFSRKDFDLACALYDSKKSELKYRIVFNIWNIGRILRQRTKWPHGTTTFLISKKSVFTKINGFDENLRVGSDLDFIKRAVNAGFRYRVLPTKFQTSTRRFNKKGLFSVLFAGFIIGILLGSKKLKKNKKTQDKLENLYGEWGK